MKCKSCKKEIKGWSIQTNVGIFCNDCKEIAILRQQMWRFRQEMTSKASLYRNTVWH